ncbi:hypothetical protein A5791_06450 [Mycobacterium sp. 852002-51163_SCH5372311]|nr:hypothetical protein A5791_06450 [Mycobacterium sp. 852002-51163_SCH5372311]
MGEVWRAFDVETQRVVAVKVLPAQLADDPTFAQRFRREAFAAAGLANPHVVPIHQFGEIDGRLYVDMRLIEGRDLHQIISEGPLPLPRAVSIIEQVASALQAAHRIGLVHRDVKPSNVLVDDEDFAYLIDFGIARGAGHTKLTNTGSVIGTWAYMAPERLSTDQTDARSDVYALACVLHECMTGSQPFPAASLDRQIAAHVADPPPRPSALQPTVPTSMDAVIAKGMAKNPDERYQTVKDLANAARAAATTYPTSAAESALVPQDAQTPLSPSIPTAHDTAAPTAHAPMPLAAPAPAPAPTPAADAAKSGKGRRITFVGAAAVFVAVIAVIAGVALMPNSHSGSGDRPTAAPASAMHPNTGPFTGTFTVAMGPGTELNGGRPETDAFSEAWRLRSACGANGCVATATTGGQYPVKNLVFDNVGGRWLTVTTSQRKCGAREDDEAWNVISLQPQADGSVSGEATQITTNGCSNKRAVVFTRTADTDISQLPDPAALPPRVVSPAEALHGGYDLVVNFANSAKRTYHKGVRTDCLRTGDRCMSNFLDSKTAAGSPFVFQTGAWNRNQDYDSDCSSGGTIRIKATTSLPLPQPPQNPITLLTGHGYQEVLTSSKCPSQAFDVTYTRTGD